MRDRTNVRLHFVGHADTLPLSEALQAVFGDNVGLSRERAGTTAEYFQQALGLPPKRFPTKGSVTASRSPATPPRKGRQLNRRVEVQVWYDEVGEKLVEKEVLVTRELNRIKICRTETVCKLRYKEGHAHRARIKNLMPPLHYDDGVLVVPPEFLQQVRYALRNLGRQAERGGQVHRLHRQPPAGGPGRAHLRRPRRLLEGGGPAGGPRRAGRAGAAQPRH
jgi:hypothetical protein